MKSSNGSIPRRSNLSTQVASAATAETSVFVGRYTDPKHPGGYRDIELLPGAQIGPYKLANVRGGQGVAEPEAEPASPNLS